MHLVPQPCPRSSQACTGWEYEDIPQEQPDDRSFVAEPDEPIPAAALDINSLDAESSGAPSLESTEGEELEPCDLRQLAQDCFEDKRQRQQGALTVLSEVPLQVHMHSPAASVRGRCDLYGVRQPEARKMAEALRTLFTEAHRHTESMALIPCLSLDAIAAAAVELFAEIAVYPAAIESLVKDHDVV